jgi:predicted dehydrogenase
MSRGWRATLIEKPLASTYAEGEAIVRAAGSMVQ